MRHKIQYENLPENPEKHKKEFVEKMYAKQRGLRAKRRLKEHLEKQTYRKPVKKLTEGRKFRNNNTINNQRLLNEVNSISGRLDLKRFIENDYDINVEIGNYQSVENALTETIKICNILIEKIKRYL